MRLTVQNYKPIENPNENDIKKLLYKLVLVSDHEFACLENSSGNFVQVAGGGITCMVELRDTATMKHFRGYDIKSKKHIPDGTKLRFAGQEIELHSDEWISNDKAIEVFVAFLNNKEYPDWLRWRDISSLVGL